MKPRNNTPVLFGVIALALLGIAVLNKNQYDSRPKSTQELANEEAERMNAAQASASAESRAAADLQEELLSLPPDQIIGSKTGSTKIVIGYTWDPAVQADPQKARAGLMTLREMLETMNKRTKQDIQYRLVNTDIVRTERPGVWHEGQLLTALELATLQTNTQNIIQSIMSKLNLSSS